MLNQYNVRLAIYGLTLLGGLAVCGCIGLALLGSHDPSGLCTLAGTALGALAALVVPPRPPHLRNGEAPGPDREPPGPDGPP